MRINILGPPPWAPSGYGVQTDLLSRGLRDGGHEVGISAFAGVHQEACRDGITILSCGGRSFGNGLIAGNYHRWKAELLIIMCDAWSVEPGQLAGLRVMPYMPLDCEPLGVMDQSWLGKVADVAAALRPVAMSAFGARMLDNAGCPGVPVIPHMIRPEMVPGERGSWRREQGISDDAFLIALVGVNDDSKPPRKAFYQAMCAFRGFLRTNPKSKLYIHAEPQPPKRPNLAAMAMRLGLKDHVLFPDEYERGADLIGPAYMAAMHRDADVLSAASRAEGFGVPIIESLACGTPVIVTRCSAMTELITPRTGWLIDGDPEWADHHMASWVTPRISELRRAYERAFSGAHLMRSAAARAGLAYLPSTVMPSWEAVISDALDDHPDLA